MIIIKNTLMKKMHKNSILQINFSELARKHCPNTKLGNMVVKEFLENEDNVNLSQFKLHRKKKNPVVRRKRKRMLGEVTVPTPRTNTEIKKSIQKEIESGKYNMGNMVVPRQYKKLTISKDGNIEEVTFFVSARQIPLYGIRQQTLKDHEAKALVRDHSDKKYMQMTADQVTKQLKFLGEYNHAEEYTVDQLKEKLKEVERARHLIAWSDHSCIMNHGHLLSTVYMTLHFTILVKNS